MTTIKWRELTAKQKDGHVAEMVMGLRVYRYPDIHHPDKIVPGRVVIVDEDNIIIAKPEPYSTNMDAAMNAAKEHFRIIQIETQIHDHGTYVDAMVHHVGKYAGECRAILPEAEALCIAMLRAKGCQVIL